MAEIEKDCIHCEGIVVYQYNFLTKDNKQLKFAKLLVNVKGLPVYINSSKFVDKPLYSTILCDVTFNGKDWKVK